MKAMITTATNHKHYYILIETNNPYNWATKIILQNTRQWLEIRTSKIPTHPIKNGFQPKMQAQNKNFIIKRIIKKNKNPQYRYSLIQIKPGEIGYKEFG